METREELRAWCEEKGIDVHERGIRHWMIRIEDVKYRNNNNKNIFDLKMTWQDRFTYANSDNYELTLDRSRKYEMLKIKKQGNLLELLHQYLEGVLECIKDLNFAQEFASKFDKEFNIFDHIDIHSYGILDRDMLRVDIGSIFGYPIQYNLNIDEFYNERIGDREDVLYALAKSLKLSPDIIEALKCDGTMKFRDRIKDEKVVGILHKYRGAIKMKKFGM